MWVTQAGVGSPNGDDDGTVSSPVTTGVAPTGRPERHPADSGAPWARISGVSNERRPWGQFAVLSDEETHKVKRITVDPGHRLSYQRHAQRSEHWFVISGHGVVTIDGDDRPVGAGNAVDVPVGSAHRITNPGSEPLVFVEVQHGTSFGEDDIERLDDDYGRGPSA